MIVTPNLHFDGCCEQAVRLYETAFGAVTKVFLRYAQADLKDLGPEDHTPKDFVYHAEIWLGGQRIMMSDSLAMAKGNATSLVLTFDDADSVKRAYQALQDGCHIIRPMVKTGYSSCFVSLVDRYGIRWELMTEQAER